MTEPTWMIVELMGHVRHVGLVTEVEMFGAKLGRVDALQRDGTTVTTYFGGSSVYRLTPTDEATCRRMMAPPEPLPYRPRWDEDGEARWESDVECPRTACVDDTGPDHTISPNTTAPEGDSTEGIPEGVPASWDFDPFADL